MMTKTYRGLLISLATLIMMNGWVLAALLGLLGGEWLLRKRWGLP